MSDLKTPNDDIPNAKEDFNKAANPPKQHEEPEPTLDLNPPGPAGPDLPTPAPGGGGAPQISPQLRDDDRHGKDQNGQDRSGPAADPSLRRVFNKEARKGAFRAAFNEQARDKDNGIER